MPRRLVPLLAVVALLSCSGQPAREVAPSSAPEPPITPTPTTAPTSSSEPAAPSVEPQTTTTTTLVPLGRLELALAVVADGFEQPVLAIAPPGDARLFVVDQPGIVWVTADGDPEVFLDLRDDVVFGGERGLLGLAFHPDYADNGLFYVDYVGTGNFTRIAEYAVSVDADRADPASRRVLLEIRQPANNHNGGMVAFGPDGNLWIGMGDGGGANDEFGNGQRPDTLLGAMLRIGVGPEAPEPYGIPADNPYADGEDGAPEVRAIGTRNPWRFTFDGDLLYVADVGQNAIEEIDVVAFDDPRANFGWPIKEGDECFRASPCDADGLIDPVLVYGHDEGCSVTGGFVYRGVAIPELEGHFLYGDYCAGWVRSLTVTDDAAPEVASEHEWFPPGTASNLTSFGTDSAGELLVVTADGAVARIVRG